MKRFIFEVIAVLLIAFLPFYILQGVIDKKAKTCYKPPYSSFNYIYNGTLNADVVIFGNSRAQCHYYGDLMDSLLDCNCYNLGLSAHSFDYQYNLQIIPYLKKNEIPKLMVLEVGPQAFFGQWNPHFRKEFLPFVKNDCFTFYMNICKEVSWKDIYLPFKYYGFGLDGYIPFFKKIIIDDSQYSYRDCFHQIWKPKYQVNFPDILYPLEKNDTIIQYFTEFINLCKNKNVPLLLVCSPMHKEDFYDKCQMTEFWQLIDSLAPNIPKLDYSLMFGSDTTYFAESTHLNLLGAEVFTTKFAHDVDSLGLLK